MDVHIAFRGMPTSPALEARIRQHVAHLEKFCDEIGSCHVVVEVPHRHKHQGNHFCARVDLKVPQGEIFAGHDSEERHEHEDAYVAVNHAFKAAGRQLQDYVTRRRERNRPRAVSPGDHLDGSD